MHLGLRHHLSYALYHGLFKKERELKVPRSHSSYECENMRFGNAKKLQHLKKGYCAVMTSVAQLDLLRNPGFVPRLELTNLNEQMKTTVIDKLAAFFVH